MFRGVSDHKLNMADHDDCEKVEVADEESLGCKHYKRKCIFISPCCNKEYTCRICHDECEDHELNRRDVKKIKCAECSTIQGVMPTCTNCKIRFSKYFCKICNLYDDDISKQQFHCDGCGLCRIGGREQFFHCSRCDLCLAISLKDNHRCVEKASHDVCPICRDDLHTSRMNIHVPKCGHLIHFNCYHGLLSSNNYACPTCNVSLIDMKDTWEHLDEALAETEMPEEYRNIIVDILCRDCHKIGKAPFHVVGLKCSECGSYNTCRN